MIFCFGVKPITFFGPPQNRPASAGFFLDSEEGQPYVESFRALRLVHPVNHHLDMEMLYKGNVKLPILKKGLHGELIQTK